MSIPRGFQENKNMKRFSPIVGSFDEKWGVQGNLGEDICGCTPFRTFYFEINGGGGTCTPHRVNSMKNFVPPPGGGG